MTSVMVRTEDGGKMECAVVPSEWNREGDPRWEVEAPDGWRFDDDVHVLVCFDVKDARQRVSKSGVTLTRCPDDCDCRMVAGGPEQ